MLGRTARASAQTAVHIDNQPLAFHVPISAILPCNMGDITRQYGSFYRAIWLELKCTMAEMEKQGRTVCASVQTETLPKSCEKHRGSYDLSRRTSRKSLPMPLCSLPVCQWIKLLSGLFSYLFPLYSVPVPIG